jgi:phenylalanyl-tRNA synthetase beta chain
MRVPLAWLRDYVDLPADSGVIAARLASLGFPVETIETRPHISGVVVGTIVKLEKHPNADKLQVCTLEIGAPATLTIATAATNVAQGQIVPVATIGAQLPQLTIAPRKMRGIDSQGMLCSAEELGLPAEWFEDGILQLDAVAPNGTDVVAHFGLDLPVLEVEIGANRGDALSIVGIARELAAGFRTQLRPPPTLTTASPAAAGLDSSDVRVTLESVDVRRYVAQRVTGVRVGRSPAAIRIRLALAGQRPISNLVDISNFVMLECGQPLHFFDFDKIAGKHIIVRDAVPGEHLVTLDGVDRELDPSALLIADAAQATGLAGLMGGEISEVSDTTSEIVIESANFAGPRIRRMSLRVGLRTEASTRNEKNLAPALADLGAARAAFLLAAEGATVHAPRVYGAALVPAVPISLDPRDVLRLLGFTVTADEIEGSLQALGFEVKRLPRSAGDDHESRDAPDRGIASRPVIGDGGGPTTMPKLSSDAIALLESRLDRLSEEMFGPPFAVTPPAWRSDVAIAPDLVEEIARIIGYDRVAAELPPIAPQTLTSSAFDREMTIAQTLAGLGYSECLTLALQPHSVAERWRGLGLDVPAVVEIRNPLSEDQRWMRFSLLPALLAHAARERASRPLRTFEIGHVFADAPDAPRETGVVTLLATTKPIPDQPSWRDAAYGAAASDVLALVRAVTGIDARLERATTAGLHPGKTARIVAGDVSVGFVGRVDPRLLRADEISDDAVAAIVFIEALPPPHPRRFVAISRYPAVERDLAIIVDPAVPAADIVATIRAAVALARSVDVFDEYRGPQIGSGKKSLAVRIVLQRDDATLTDADADAAIARAIAALASAHGATLRG